MTAEIPKQELGKCTKCNDKIILKQNQRGSLKVTCGCGITRNVRVDRATPDTWNL